MNLRELAALKEGDKIENPSTGSKGVVVEATDSGVRVIWGERYPDAPERERKFFYSSVGTAWMNWAKPE